MRSRTPLQRFLNSLAVIAAGTAWSLLTGASPAVAAPPFLLVVYASGGWDQTMVFDSKIGASTVAAESGQSSASGGGGISYVDHAGRPAVQAFFKTYGDRSAIVNGVFVGGMDRAVGQKQLFTAVPTGKSRPVDWATLYTDAAGFSGDLPHVVFEAPFAPGEYTSQVVHLTTATIAEYQAGARAVTALDDNAEAALKALRAKAMVTILDKIAPNSLDLDKLNALAKGFASDEPLSTELTAAVTSVGAQASDDTFTYQAKLAIELFHQGASLAATVQAGPTNTWNTLRDNFSEQNTAYQNLFSDLAKILAYAQSRGLSDNLTLVVMSEGGRAPQLNTAGGKGPWPYTSLLLWGAGIKGGQVVGSSDANLRGVAIDPIFGGTDKSTSVTLTPAHIWSAIYTRAGLSTNALVGSTPPLAQVIKP